MSIEFRFDDLDLREEPATGDREFSDPVDRTDTSWFCRWQER
jgi:hypothetical protein